MAPKEAQPETEFERDFETIPWQSSDCDPEPSTSKNAFPAQRRRLCAVILCTKRRRYSAAQGRPYNWPPCVAVEFIHLPDSMQVASFRSFVACFIVSFGTISFTSSAHCALHEIQRVGRSFLQFAPACPRASAVGAPAQQHQLPLLSRRQAQLSRNQIRATRPRRDQL